MSTVVPDAHVGGEEALVVDGWIEGDLVAAPGVVAWQAGLVAGLARDVAAGEEEIGDKVQVGVGDDPTAGRFDGVDGGVGGSIAKMSNGVRIPRWSGRSGWTSTMSGGRPAPSRAVAMAATTVVMPPEWSQCQCDRNSTSMLDRSTASRSAFASQTSP